VAAVVAKSKGRLMIRVSLIVGRRVRMRDLQFVAPAFDDKLNNCYGLVVSVHLDELQRQVVTVELDGGSLREVKIGRFVLLDNVRQGPQED
jgi:hypothetical protein